MPGGGNTVPDRTSSGGPRLSRSILVPFVAESTVRQRKADGYYPFPDVNLLRRMVPFRPNGRSAAERENVRLRGRSFCGMTSAGRRNPVPPQSPGTIIYTKHLAAHCFSTILVNKIRTHHGPFYGWIPVSRGLDIVTST